MNPQKITRREFFKKIIRFTGILFWLSSLSYIYARYFEPKQLKVIRHDLTSTKIPKSFHNYRIVQFSDTHIGHNYDLNQLKQLVKQINDLEPDIILFSGDLMDAPNEYPFQQEMIPILKQLNAPLGKFAIYGNHDHGGYGSTDYKNIMEKSDFYLLMNESYEVINDKNESIMIAGLDDIILGAPDPFTTFENIREEQYTILMVHEPDIAERLKQFPISLQLSGHSHGGQVKLPFVGPLYTPPGANLYYEGFYTIEEKEFLLYVNRGIGTTRLPFRFLSYPELTVFTLKSI